MYVEEWVFCDMLKVLVLIFGIFVRKYLWLLDMYLCCGYEVYFEYEEDGDVGVMMWKILILEKFDVILFGIFSWI